MIAVAVQPFQVAPGEEHRPGPHLRTERRPTRTRCSGSWSGGEILSGDTRLTVLEEKLSRGNGTFTSRQPIGVPPDLSPRPYTRGFGEGSGRGSPRFRLLFEVIDNSSD